MLHQNFGLGLLNLFHNALHTIPSVAEGGSYYIPLVMFDFLLQIRELESRWLLSDISFEDCLTLLLSHCFHVVLKLGVAVSELDPVKVQIFFSLLFGTVLSI